MRGGGGGRIVYGRGVDCEGVARASRGGWGITRRFRGLFGKWWWNGGLSFFSPRMRVAISC